MNNPRDIGLTVIFSFYCLIYIFLKNVIEVIYVLILKAYFSSEFENSLNYLIVNPSLILKHWASDEEMYANKNMILND